MELLPKDHRIIEKGRMEFQPFGRTPDGRRIDDVSGVPMRARIDCLQETVALKQDREAGEHAVEELVRLLNERIPDPSYHVTPAFLKNPWNGYSHEFSLFLAEFCSMLSGVPDFHAKVGKRIISPMIRTLGRPFSVQQIYKMCAHFGDKYVKAVRFEPVQIEENHAILRITFSENSLRQMGRYRNACVTVICGSIKAACSAVPEAVHGQLPATVKDRACVGNGDPYCEWDITWDSETRGILKWGTAAGVAAIAAFIVLRAANPLQSLVEGVLLSLIPALAVWELHRRFVLRRELQRRGELIEEQALTTETRHEQLRDAYMEQEQRVADLQRAYREIEELNVGLESKVSQRTADLEDANTRLKELDNLKSQFLAHVSHELRTPLTCIQGFADNMLAELGGPLTGKQKQNLQRITANAGRLHRMIGNLLDQSRIEVGKIEVSPSHVQFPQLVEDAVEHMKPLAQAKQQSLELLCSQPQLMVWGDADMLRQVVTNLLDNAIKYSPPQGHVRIAITQQGAELAKLSVTDSGNGIPRGSLQKVFDAFYRVESEQGREVKGFGLGLSIVKTLIELHGGQVTVESEEGKGTSFHVTLPISQKVLARSAEGAVNVRRLLIVDDDPDIRQFLIDRLEGAGYALTAAKTGREAIAALSAEAFDGAILDIGLPELDGIEVLRYLRAQNLKMPVLIITAAESRERAMRAVETGAQAYLLKPFDAGQFERVVFSCFGKRVSDQHGEA
jgi:signal transduction histidine kinase/ActR/RegA family two-component response regulator